MTASGFPRRSCTLVLLLIDLLSFLTGVASEIRSFNGRINAASNYIHYSDGYLAAPGYVDLSDLVFTTVDEDDLDDDGVDGDGSHAHDDAGSTVREGVVAFLSAAALDLGLTSCSHHIQTIILLLNPKTPFLLSLM